ncbi:tetraacyldisaccharide 4'-kinase [Fulvivirga sp. 29W222]|uniref:Tetraacyldisaccharide 4'-kinase n=1 Tax=Fulvivirga marina TaxID=2494733 RepID=A0A937FWY7_9BACT|nr:tetraacyldisaccharide 4'-kinase [Fulvivirga marina]MBL6445911.1 tetraacyldisaccharide 4'-kinase [Fulvivirga marina]
MNFLGILLFPFALIYDLITRFRNYLYNSGYKHSFEFEANVISVGNLSVGGTGKSPMVEYLIRLFNDKKVVTLSRGYGRSTRGFRLANDDDSPKTIGDEPYQFFNKFKNIHVAVGEQRAIAIPFILAEQPQTEVILLDDAFQHRPVKPSLSILLTDYNKPFFNDFVLPSGRLRESRKGAQRADMIVVTKCLDSVDFQYYEDNIRRYNSRAHIAFASIKYMEPERISGSREFSNEVFLFSGIANPAPLRAYVSSHYRLEGEHHFRDHHRYKLEDIAMLINAFEEVGKAKCLITTEKDMVKLLPFIKEGHFKNIPVFYLPIETVFIKGGKRFDETILNSLKAYSY